MTMLSVVIPALNEERGIADIAARVLLIQPRLAEAGVGDLELIVVDDGSTDRTAAMARGIAGVTVISHPVNQGYGAAIKTGFRHARGDILAFIDADGTYPPECFPELCAVLLGAGADVVVGSRMGHGDTGMPAVRRLGNTFFAGLVSLIGPESISDSASGQRVLWREALEKLYPLPDGLNFTPVMTTRTMHENLRMVEVPIPYQERVGRSKLSVVHDGRRFLTTILWTSMGYNPSRVLGIAGLAFLGLGFVMGLGLVLMRAAGIQTLGPWGVMGAFGTLVLGVAGVSLVNLGIAFNYLVSLFHKAPVRQGLFGRSIWPGLDRAFGWLGLLAMTGGILVAGISLRLQATGWDITRVWLWLLGSALGLLVGLQLTISWVLMRVLEELSVRELRTRVDLGRDARPGPITVPGDPTGAELGTRYDP